MRRLTMNNPKAKLRLKELGLKTTVAAEAKCGDKSGPSDLIPDGTGSLGAGVSLLTAQSSNSQTRVSTTLTVTSSTRTDESATALDSVINADVELLKPRLSNQGSFFVKLFDSVIMLGYCHIIE